jgi:hypothetical protein
LRHVLLRRLRASNQEGESVIKIAKVTPNVAVGRFDYSSLDNSLAKALKVAAKK